MTERDKAAAKRLLKNMKQVYNEIRYDEIQNEPVLVGRKTENEEISFIHVLDKRRKLTIKKFKGIFKISGKSSIILSVRDEDSTNVLYKCEKGLKSPYFRSEKNLPMEQVLNMQISPEQESNDESSKDSSVIYESS